MNDSEYFAKLAYVKAAREQAEQLTQEVATEKTRWNTEHQDLLKAAANAAEIQARAEAELRNLVLAEHTANGRTKFEYGVQVKVFEGIKYDEAKALFWAHENFKAAVKTSLDKPVFDAFAKHHPLPGLVEIVKTPKAMLPTKIVIEDELLERMLDVQAGLAAPIQERPPGPKDRYEPNEGGA